jgi:aryl-alcohol dehydrogenase-like predicted oxidoreductase
MTELPAVLGAMYFGTKTDERTSFALLDRFVEAGGTIIDTANCYAFWASPTGAGGQSEAVLGRWLAANPGLRERLTIATKVGAEPAPGGIEGLSAATIARESARSLDRLGIETIDLYWSHVEDRSADLADTMAGFAELVDAGTVRRIGVSNHPTWRVERANAIAAAHGWTPYTALQLSTSYVRPRPDTKVPGKDHRFGFLTDETRDFVDNHPGMEVWAYSPLIQGSYARADRPFPEVYDHPGTTRRLEALSAVAKELAATPSQVVLAWLVNDSPQILPIVGVSTIDQLDEALAGARLELSPDQLARLNAAA